MWESYLDSLDKKERHEIRRKLRRLEREAPEAQVRLVTGGPELDAALATFIALHRLSSRAKDAFMTDEMQDFFRAIAAILAERGWLQLSFLEIAGQPVASYFCFDYGNQTLVYNSGYDPQASPQLSPGWVLLARLIEHAIAQGRTRFDFLQGNEDYKHRFGGVDEPVYRTLIRGA
jgi:CelD/BcsL family acetyltransferase involved in cellulose biosynthesis